jgi:hypothetical protein
LAQAGTNRSGGAASNLTGEVVGHVLASGDLEASIQEKLIPAYQHRYLIMRNAIEKDLLPLGVTLPYAQTTVKEIYGTADVDKTWLHLHQGREDETLAGGYFMYLRLPAGISADKLTKRAQKSQNLVVTPETMCRVPHKDSHGQVMIQADHDQFIRLCFAWEEESALTEGIDRLGKVLKDMLAGTDNDHYDQPIGSMNQYS